MTNCQPQAAFGETAETASTAAQVASMQQNVGEKAMPLEPGFYWVRDRNGEETIIEIYDANGRAFQLGTSKEIRTDIKRDDGFVVLERIERKATKEGGEG